MLQRAPCQEPVIGGIARVAGITDKSTSSIRRIMATDPTFPKPFQLTENGDLQWVLSEVYAWLEAKAGRPLAA